MFLFILLSVFTVYSFHMLSRESVNQPSVTILSKLNACVIRRVKALTPTMGKALKYIFIYYFVIEP